MTRRIYLSPPHVGELERLLLLEALESGYVAPAGPHLERFESAFGDLTGWRHCVALTSCTAALHLALHLHGVGSGDLVAASTLTFIGGVNPIVYCGAQPVFIDASPDTWNMDCDLLAEFLERSARRGRLPKAVVPTDLYGQCADLERITEECSRYGVQVIADAAESLGATCRGRAAGIGAAAAAYSFNGNKIVTTSGGGMLASDDAALIERARHLAQQAREPLPHYEHRQIGFNYRMSNLLAALGLAQLQRLPQRVAQKRALFEQYREALASTPGIDFMPEASYGESSRWLTVILVTPDVFGADRETLRRALERRNIEARPVWKPMHLQPVFRGAERVGGEVAEDLFARGLCLPSGTALRSEDVRRVVETILACRKH